jgi:leucyl aminopeptidase
LGVLVTGREGAGATPIHGLSPDELAASPYAGWARTAGFTAAAGSVLLVPGGAGGVGEALFGLGKRDAADRNPLLAGRLATGLPAGTFALASGFDDLELATIAFGLGAYRFTRYRAASDEPPRLAVSGQVDVARVMRIVEGVTLARDLINTPANDLGPAELAEAAREQAGRHGAVFNEIRGDDLATDFPLIHAVGRAAVASRAPRLVEVTWGDPGHPKITLVGKGVCFDTGGLDIKTSAGMLLMKKDMGGAANVLGLAHMIMDARLPVRLRVLIPAVENAIAGAAFRPGDILQSRKGTTVEIGNTDAEGRLVLADALTFGGEDSPDLMIDLATLTGAARVALGPDLPAFFTRDDALAAEVLRNAAGAADPAWRLPLWLPYFAMLDSKVADINNAGSTPFAGSITAALFLSKFVAESTPWIHGDIFAWNPSAKPGKPEGGEAQLIRALYDMLEDRYRPG